MLKNNDFSLALHAIYDAAYAPDQLRRALDTAKKSTQTFGALLWAHGVEETFQYREQLGCSVYQQYAPVLAEYNRTFINGDGKDIDSQAILATHDFPVETPIFDSDVFDMRTFEDRPEIRFLRQVAGVGNRFWFNLSLDPAFLSGLVFNYPVQMREIPRHDLIHTRQLSSHFAKALDIARWGHALRTKYNAVLGVLNKIEMGVVVMDKSHRPILVNTYAQNVFSDRAGIWIDGQNQLRTRSDDLTAEMRDAIARVASTAVGEDDSTAIEFPVSRGSERPPLLVICSPLRDANMELEKHLTGCLLTVIDAEQSPPARVDAFAACYGLTPTEKKIVPLLVEGLSAPQIGEEMNVARSTTETHIKSIMAKTGSKSRVSLVWKMVQFSPPVN
ncbi:MAG: hypothetical protein GJ676_05645 [Rhodobacteraceae bacterium]|nr:hypothetical protein [Paracoccaceae bacterium]